MGRMAILPASRYCPCRNDRRRTRPRPRLHLPRPQTSQPSAISPSRSSRGLPASGRPMAYRSVRSEHARYDAEKELPSRSGDGADSTWSAASCGSASASGSADLFTGPNGSAYESGTAQSSRGPGARARRGWLDAPDRELRTDRYADLQLDPDFLHLRRGNTLFDLPPSRRDRSPKSSRDQRAPQVSC